jgi:hypothetical protein
MRAAVIFPLGLFATVFLFISGFIDGNADARSHAASSEAGLTKFEGDNHHQFLANRRRLARLRKRLSTATSGDNSHATANMLSVETCKKVLLDDILAEEAEVDGLSSMPHPSNSEMKWYLPNFMSEINLCLEDFTPYEQNAIWQVAGKHSKREPATVDCFKQDEHLKLEEVEAFRHDVNILIGEAAIKEKQALCRENIEKEKKERFEHEFNSCTVAKYACAAELSPTQANDLLELLREQARSKFMMPEPLSTTTTQLFWRTLSTQQQRKLSAASRNLSSSAEIDWELDTLVSSVERSEELQELRSVEDD